MIQDLANSEAQTELLTSQAQLRIQQLDMSSQNQARTIKESHGQIAQANALIQEMSSQMQRMNLRLTDLERENLSLRSLHHGTVQYQAAMSQPKPAVPKGSPMAFGARIMQPAMPEGTGHQSGSKKRDESWSPTRVVEGIFASPSTIVREDPPQALGQFQSVFAQFMQFQMANQTTHSRAATHASGSRGNRSPEPPPSGSSSSSSELRGDGSRKGGGRGSPGGSSPDSSGRHSPPRDPDDSPAEDA